MIKKLQALRAKKGFTLVELVVVIAIIGVLAAILIPTMMGVVQDSNITAADSTANQVKTQTTTFLTKMDAAKHGLRGVGDTIVTLDIDVSGGTWTVTPPAATVKFGDGSKAKWLDGSSDDKNFHYDAFMADVLRDLKDADIRVYLQNGACIGVALVEGTGDFPSLTINWANNAAQFDGSKPGLMADGTIIGSNPKLQIGS